MKCLNCGNEVDSSWPFCPFCGESIKKSCPSCGKEVKEGWPFCPFCGTKLGKIEHKNSKQVKKEEEIIFDDETDFEDVEEPTEEPSKNEGGEFLNFFNDLFVAKEEVIPEVKSNLKYCKMCLVPNAKNVVYCKKCGGKWFYDNRDEMEKNSKVKYCMFCGAENDVDSKVCCDCGKIEDDKTKVFLKCIDEYNQIEENRARLKEIEGKNKKLDYQKSVSDYLK